MWLSRTTFFKLSKNNCERKKGRPHLKYSDGSERLQRQLASKVLSTQENDSRLLLHAASMSAHAAKEHDLNFVLKHTASSPSKPKEVRKLIVSADKKPTRLTPA